MGLGRSQVCKLSAASRHSFENIFRQLGEYFYNNFRGRADALLVPAGKQQIQIETNFYLLSNYYSCTVISANIHWAQDHF